MAYFTQQCRFTSNFHKINKQKHKRWMEQTKCQKCRPITRIHAQGRLRHSSVARQSLVFFGIMKFCLVYSLTRF